MNAIEQASMEVQLLKAGWVEKYGIWSHPRRLYQGKPYLFNFEDACLAERIMTKEEES